jgi:hypothetical protein
MNCIEFEGAMELSVETRQPLEPAALNHTLDCENCRSEWDIHRQLDTVIEVWRSEVGLQAVSGLTDQQLKALASTVHPATLPADLCDLVLAEFKMPPVRHRSSELNVGDHQQLAVCSISKESDSPRRSGLLAIASVAACLFLAVIFATNQPRRNSVELAQLAPPPVIEQPIASTPLDVSQTLTAVFSDIRSEYREMASETTSVARDLVNVFPQHVTVPFQASHNELELRPTSGDVVRIWRPISSQVESALGFLWQAVPSEVPAG